MTGDFEKRVTGPVVFAAYCHGQRPGFRSFGFLLAAAIACLVLLAGTTAAQAASAPSSAFAEGSTPPAALQASYDVVIAGAGTGGIGAAIQAARLGASVLLLEQTDWIGGQAFAAAVSAMDEGGAGNLVRERGLYRELLQRVEAYYRPLRLDPNRAGRYTNTRIEPRVGRRLMHAMLAEAGRGTRLDLVLRAHVLNVQRHGDVVTGVEVEVFSDRGRESRTVASKVLIDATEWGDVLPLAGARYRAGNRTSDALEPTRLTQEHTWTAVIKRYPAGVPASLRITQPPTGYEQRQPFFAKAIVPGAATYRRGEPMSWSEFVDYRGVPNSESPQPPPLPLSRTHLNYTNDYPCTVGYLEDSAQRVATDRAMRLRTLQLLYFIQHELGVTDWSVADDEGFDSPYNRGQIDAWLRDAPEMEPYRQILHHFSVIPYVRESRRMIGLHTLLAREISRGPGNRPIQFPSTIGLGDYRLDLHGGKTRADMELDLDRMEDLADAVPGRAGPFAIPMECLVPERLDGFLAAEKNYSQSRLVNGATRMQPHTLNVGQAAGALAALAVRHGVPPRRIDPVLVQRVLLAARSTLNITPLQDVPQEGADWPAIQLVSVRGLLALEEGRFFPQRPLNRSELRAALSQLGERASSPGDDLAAVARSEFAQALAMIAPAEVKLIFEPASPEARLPITRSEAAQVFAELLELRALGRLQGAAQVLRWKSLRPASLPAPSAGMPAANRHVRRLLDAKIISSAQHWEENAVAGKECEGGRVAELLLQGARAIDPQATPATAVETLLRARVITSREYWAKAAVPGGRCAGRNVAALIRNLAEHETVLARTASLPKP
jgi:hypothetical protein